MEELIGLTKEFAILELRNTNTPFRVVREDNTRYVVILNFNPGRVNLEIDNGIVTGVALG